MKKTLLSVVAIILIMTGGLLFYVTPQEKLDLTYSPFAVSDKIKEMISTKRLVFHITQDDVNNLLKARLASQENIPSGWKVTGARFELTHDKLIAHLNLLYYETIPIGTTSYYQLTWDAPNLKAIPLYSQVRNVKLPQSVVPLPAPTVSVESFFPAYLKVRDVQFEAESILFRLRF